MILKYNLMRFLLWLNVQLGTNPRLFQFYFCPLYGGFTMESSLYYFVIGSCFQFFSLFLRIFLLSAISLIF